ncbi:MAG: calcium-binding protein, partial [Fuerstiella sp.]
MLKSARKDVAVPPRRKLKHRGGAIRTPLQALERRMMLTTIDLADYVGVSNFSLSAQVVGADRILTVADRDGGSGPWTVTLSDTVLIINGSTGDDDLHIDLSGVSTINAGTVQTRLNASLTFNGLNGNDSVSFTGHSAVTGGLSVTAESISVASGKRVDATGALVFTAIASAGAQVNNAATVNATGSSTAAISVSGDVRAGSVSMVAQTTGSVTSNSTSALSQAANTFTDTATITINGGANVEATGSLSLRAERTTSYAATGRSAVNTISGDTRVTVGATGSGSTLTSGGNLSVQAVDNLTATATSARESINPSAVQGNVTASLAQNLITGHTEVLITDSTVTQTGAGNTTAITADRTLTATARAEGESLTSGTLPSSTSLNLGGMYATNHLSGNVQTLISGGSFNAVDATVNASDNATATVKSELTMGTGDHEAAIGNDSMTFGASVAFNQIDNTTVNPAVKAINTILGTTFGTNSESKTTATFDNTTLNVSAGLAVTSDSAARVNSTVSNAVESKSSSLLGSKGSAAAGILAGNLINTASEAHVIYATSSPATVSGALSITALDSAAIFSNSKLVSSAIVTNDGGTRLLQDHLNLKLDYDHKTSQGSKAVAFGDTVLVEEGHSAGGQINGVFEYLGVAGTLDLGTTDFSDLDLWKPVEGTDIIPQGNNLTGSDSVAVGGIVVRNDVSSSATARLQNTTLASVGDVTVRAVEKATVQATADAAVTSSGGSAFGTGTSIAVGGVIASNTVQSNAQATIFGSSVTTNNTGTNTGHVNVTAQNTSSINALNKSMVQSGDTAVGAIIAFNTIGYPQSNILTQTLETLIATNIGTANPATTSATIVDTAISAAGNVTVSATSTAANTATVTNETTSAASALVDASGAAMGGVLASNMLNTDVDASIIDSAGAKGTLAATGNVAVEAVDDTSITADTVLKSVSSTSNDGGVSLVNSFAAKLLEDYQYSSRSGTKLVKFGDKVRVASDHAADKGDATAVYQYMGTDAGATLDLTAEDYSDFGFWRKLDTINIIPAGFNITDSDSIGIGGMVVRNDLVADVDAVVDNMTVSNAKNVTIAADGSQNLTATSDATASSSGGSAYGSGQSLAVGASIVTNSVQGGAEAHLLDSHVTTTGTGTHGDVTVTATNSAAVDATNKSAITSGDTAVGVTLAFNTLGYASQDVLTRAIDALIGTDIGTAVPAKAVAFIRDTPVVASGDVTVQAHSEAQLKASLTNETTSAASALVNASGMAIGTVLASNIVQSAATADIDFSTAGAASKVTSGGDVLVQARDRAGIDAQSQLDATSTTTNDGGVSTAIAWLNQFFDNQYDYTTKSGTRDLGGLDYQFETTSGTQTLGAGTRVLKRGTGASDRDQVYSFIGVSGSSTASVDLGAEDYTDTTRWQPVYHRRTTKVRIGNDFATTNIRGNIYRFIGSPDAGVNLATEDYTVTSRWEKVTQQSADFVPQIGNITDSDSIGVGVLVVRNDARSDVTANIDKTIVQATGNASAGNVTVNALEQADIRALTQNVTSSSGGSAFGEGTSLAVGTTVATNMVLSSASSTITSSSIDADGNLTVFGENRAGIDATANTSVSSGDTAVGATLAFNTLGYQSQNVLLATIDALLQTSIGTPQPSKAEAYVRDTPLTVDGNVSVTADNNAALNATISNAADSAASALFGASGAAASILVTSNMVSTDADASVDFTEPGTPTATPDGTITVGGTLLIKAKDDTQIFSNVKLVARSSTSNNGGVSVLKNSLQALSSTPSDFVSSEGTRTIDFGQTVRVANDHTAGGDAGSRYKYMGPAATSLDLTTVDYSDAGYWYEVSATKFLPEGLNVTDSDSIAVGGLVVRNDVVSDVDAVLKNTDADVVGTVTITAIEDAVIRSLVDAETSSSGGSAFGEGTSLAVSGAIATNNVVSSADAKIEDSDVTTTGTGADIDVLGTNTSFISARNISSTSTGDTAITGTVAFNTIGWAAQNLLFKTVNTLLGQTAIGSEQPARTAAIIEDSTITAADAVNVKADNSAKIQATIGNKTDSQAAALTGASGMAVGLAITTNLVNSDAEAKIHSTTAAKRNVTAGAGGITVEAQDQAAITANSKLQSLQSTTNDAGLGLLIGAVVALDGVDFTDRSGTRTVTQDDLVLIDSVDYSTYELPDTVTQGDRVELEFDVSGGSAGDVFEYIAVSDLTGGVDFEKQNFGDATKWRKLNAAPEEIYKFLGSSAASINLATEDYTNAARWLPMSKVNPTSAIPGLSLNVSDSDSAAFGGLVVRNDIKSDVDAFVDDVVALASGDIYIHAALSGVINAQTRSTVTSSGGSAAGDGSSIAVNAVIVANVINTTADGFARDSSLTTTGSGDVRLLAENDSKTDATIAANVESNGRGIGVVLAFNTIGWAAQNFLFSSVDAIIGSSIGAKTPATTGAKTLNTAISAAGSISVEAESDAAIDARITNSNSTISVTPAGGSDTITVGAILAMNKVATDVDAAISTATTLSGGSGLTVSVGDDSRITSDVEASSVAIGAGTADSSGVAIGVTLARNEINADADALIDGVTTGNITGNVLVAADKDALINAAVTSTAIGVALSTGQSVAVSGSGALAFNTILGSSNAKINSSTLVTSAGGGEAGDLAVTTDDDSRIDALVRSVSVSVAVGAKTAAGIAIGLSVAKNQIGWDTGTTTHDHLSTAKPTALTTGQKVKVVGGPLGGRIFSYIGASLSDGSGIDLSTVNYFDKSAWTPADLSTDAAEVFATVAGSNITAAGDLDVAADSDSEINAVVLSGAVGVAGGKTAVAVSAAGVYTENTIRTDVRGRIIGGTIIAKSVEVSADDGSAIRSVAGAASVAAAVGKTAVSVSIGLSLAFNEITSETEASVTGSASVTTNIGNVDVSAISRGTKLFDMTFSASQLDDASRADGDNGSTSGTNEATVDATGDAAILAALKTALEGAPTNALSFPLHETVRSDWAFTTADGSQTVKPNTQVKLQTGYRNGGVGGGIYRYLGSSNATIDLAAENFANASNWQLQPVDLKLSMLQQGKSWLLVAGDGTSYTLTLNPDDATRIDVSRTNISAVSAAASAGIGVGQTGVAISGAGAVAVNSILTKTDAKIENAVIASASQVTVNSVNSAVINSAVLAASLAVGGGQQGVGVSLGVAVAENRIGSLASGTPGTARTTAIVKDSSVDAAGKLTLQAISSQKIGSLVFAGSVGVGVGQVGVGVSGAGVYARNSIKMDVLSQIDGDGSGAGRKFEASAIDVLATDQSTISAFAGAASVAAAFGQVGVAVSIGAAIARNDISSVTKAEIRSANDSITTQTGSLTVKAAQNASIQVIAAAASAAIAGGQVGVGVSGAGADAANYIHTSTRAQVVDSKLFSADDVVVDASGAAAIQATVLSASAGVGIGAGGLGASIGVGLARNIIGYQSSLATSPTYRSGQNPASISPNQTVLIEDGVRGGETYQYIGAARTEASSGAGIDLQAEDYGDRRYWKRIDLTGDTSEVVAQLSDTSVSAADDLSVRATSTGTIKAQVFSGSVAVGGGAVGAGISGAGVGAENRIATDVTAEIVGDGATGVTADNISVLSSDTSSITALTGAASIAGGFGGVGVAASIGVAIAYNEIDNDISASVRDGNTIIDTSVGALTVQAVDAATISSTTTAASLAVAIGGVAASVSGAGADATNVILTDTNAWISASTIHTAGDLNVRAQSNANISSSVAALAAAFAFSGAAGVGIAIGSSTAQNFVGYDSAGTVSSSVTRAYITGSQITVDGTLNQTAQSSATIVSNVAAASAAAAASLYAAAGAGAGASTKNRIGQTVRSYIENTTGAGAVIRDANITATDTSSISSFSGAAALSAAIGIGGAAAVSVALADNSITNTVESWVNNSTIGSAADHVSSDGTRVLTVGDRVRIASAQSSLGRVGAVYEFLGHPSTYQSDNAPVAVNVNETVRVASGHAAGGTVGQVYRYKGRPDDFTTANGTQTVATGKRVRLSVLYDSDKGVPGDVYEYLGSQASINLGSEDYLNTANWKNVTRLNLAGEDFSSTTFWQNISSVNLGTENYGNTSVWREVDETLTITATENASITAHSYAAALSGGLAAASGGGAAANNTIATTTRAYVTGSSVTMSGDMNVRALNTSTASSTTGSSSIAVGVVSVAGGGSTTTVTITPTVAAFVTGGTVVADDISVLASATPKSSAFAFGVNAGTLAVGASSANISVAPAVSASVGGTITGSSLTIQAITSNPSTGRTADARTTGASGGVLVGANSTRTVVSHGGSVSSSVANSSQILVSGTTSVLSGSYGDHRAEADSFAGGLLAAGISSAQATSTTVVTASIGNGATVTGGHLVIGSLRDHEQFAENLAGSGGAIAGASASSTTGQSGNVTTTIGSNSTITLSGQLTGSAISTAELNGRVRTYSGGLLAGAGARLTNTANTNVLVDIGTSASIQASAITMDAGNVFRKPALSTDNIRGTTGGLVSGASAESTTTISFDTKVNVGNSASMSVTGLESNPGEFALRALNDISGQDKVSFTTGGAFSGAGADSVIRTATDNATVATGTNSVLNSVGDILMSARGTGDVRTKTNIETFGAATVGTADAVSDLRPVNQITVGSGTTMAADGDLLISAGTNTNFNRDQYNLEAISDSFAGSAIPIDDIDSTARLLQTNRIDINSGAVLQSAADIKLHAERLGLADMESKAKAVNWATAAAGAINSLLGGQETFGGSIDVGATGIVNVNGTLQTGTKRHRSLTLGGQSGGQPTGWDVTTGIIGTITSTPGLTVTQGKEILSTGLFAELDNARANLERYRTTNANLRAFYESEITRIQNELVSEGLGTIQAQDGSFTANEVYVMTAAVEPLRAQAGIVDVRADALIGDGTGVLNAPGDASVTIANHTPAQLQIKGITIPEQNGGLFLNGDNVVNSAAITSKNESGHGSASFSSITGGTGSTPPSITVSNTFDNTVYSGSVSYPNPAIVVSGEVVNLNGGFTASNPKGDIVYKASIKAANITTIAGGTVFIDGVSKHSTAGDPYGDLKSLGNGIDQYNTSAAVNLLTTAPSTILLGDTIIINAEYLNINGVIQSGKADYTLTIGASVASQIAGIKSSGTTNRYTPLQSPNPDFSLTFDLVTNRIIVRELRVSGGNVQLTGHILSTGGGTIRVLDGYADINVDNQTALDVEIERLDASKRGSGTLLLADKAKGTSASPAVTLYGDTDGATTPVDGTYAPQSNWRYGFSVGMKTATRTTTTYGSSGWLGIDALAADPSNITSGPHTEVISQPQLMAEGTYFYRAGSSLGDYTYGSVTNNTEAPRRYKTKQWSTSTWYGKTTHYQTWVEEKKQETVATHTFRADRSIAIDFIGQDEADVTVTSNAGGKIILAGPILNTTGITTVTSTAGIVQTSEDAFVGGRRVVLSSSSGEITGISTNVPDITGAGVNAVAAGDISLHEISGSLHLEQAKSTGRHTVTLSSLGGIDRAAGYSSTPNVYGGSVTLTGGSGDIGASSRYLTIDSGTAEANVFTATASGDIYLQELTGNLHVKSIVSSGGDVGLILDSGSLIDGNKLEQRDDRTYNELANGLWQDLQLTAGTGANAKVTETLNTFRASKEGEYRTYWEWRNRQANPSVYDASFKVTLTAEERTDYDAWYRSEGTASGLTGQALEDYITAAITTLENSRSQQYHTLHTTWAAYDRGSYNAGDLTAAYVTDFAYTLSQAENDALVGGIKIWTENELLYTIGAGLMKEVTDTQATIEADNISGRNVSVQAASGGVGKYTDAITIDLTQSSLTTDERVALAGAERADVVFIAGNKVTTSLNFTPDAVNGDIIGRSSGSWIDDGFKVGLHIRLESASANASPPRVYWEIAAVTASELRLVQKDVLTAETGRTATVTQVALNPTAAGLNLTAIEVGQRDDVDLTATTKLNVSASGAVFVGSENELKVENVTTSGIVALKTGDAISKAGTGTLAVQSGNLVLEAANGGIGTTSTPFNINLLADATLTARGKLDVVIVETSGNLPLETIYSQQGKVVLTSSTGSITDYFNNELVNIKAGTDIQLSAASGSIGSAVNLLDIDQGATGVLNATGKDGVYLWEALGDMRVVNVMSPDGDVILKSQLSIVDADASTDNVDVTGGSISLTAIAGGIGAAGSELEIETDSTVNDIFTASSSLGNLYVNEMTGDLYLNTLSTGTSSTAFVAVLGGSIVDARVNTNDFNILSGTVFLFAAQDIGSSANPLTTKISTVQGRSTTGSSHIHNTGHLTVTGTGLNSGSQVNLKAESPITVSSDITAAGNISIIAAEDPTAGDDLTINAGVSVNSTGGDVTLTAGDNISLQATSSVTAQNLLTIRAAEADADTIPVGAVIALNGSLTAPLTDVRGGSLNDTISVGATAAISGVLLIQGLEGADNISTDVVNSITTPVIAFGDSGTYVYDAGTHVLSSVTSSASGVGAGDTFSSSSVMALLIGGHGGDSFTGGTGSEFVIGGEADVTLSGNRVTAVTVTGTDGAPVETIDVGDGGNLVIGGTGADQITAGNGSNTILGDEGRVTFDSSGNLTLAESTNTTAGAADTFTLGGGTYRVIAGAGDETIVLGAGTNYVLGDAGRIRRNGDGTTTIETLDASVIGADAITAGEGFNVLVGGGGTDTINTQAAGGGSPSAIVLGDNGSLTLSSGGILLSAESRDFSAGDSDIITVTSGTNTIVGGRGTDTITAGGGSNTVLGDDGRISFFADGTVRKIETINSGGGARDIIELQAGTNTVIAGFGNDSVSTGGGTNFILGDEGELEVLTDGSGIPTGTTVVRTINPTVGDVDDIAVGAGRNIVVGGAAADVIDVNGNTASASAVVLGDNGTMTLSNTGTLLSIESTDFASGAADVIGLTAGTNAVIGGAGADQITAGSGSNTILGDDGRAFFFTNGDLRLIESINLGSGGADTIDLQDGTNSVIAGAGNDTITVGAGTN